ncbi:MAG: DKNYY domain-containing protein [Planctomycetota bacterium]
MLHAKLPQPVTPTTCLFAVAFATLASMAIADEELGHGYSRRGKTILFQGKRIDQEGAHDIDRFAQTLGREVSLCQNVDAASFQALSPQYSKDKQNVYYRWISPGRFWVIDVPNADPESFEVVGFNLARDKNHVWWYGSILPDVESATLELVNDGFVWKDASGVWYQQNRLAGADPKSFKHIGSGYYADKNTVFWCTTPLRVADPSTFRVLGDSFIAVDQERVYRSGQTVPNIDPASCNFILHDPYGYQVISDKNGVYLNQLKFLHADPTDFEMSDNRMARGGKYLFLIDTYHSTPLTLYRDSEQLVVESVLYERGTAKPLATMRAKLEEDRLRDMKLSPAPGEDSIHPVPDWQIDLLQRADLIETLKSASRQLND